MSKLQHQSRAVISERQMRKMIMIMADHWTETVKIVETRNSAALESRQRNNFWIEQISL